MLHEALMLEIYRQALNAGALPTARPRSTESANSSERCPSHESNSSENGKDHRENNLQQQPVGVLPLPASPNASAFPAMPNLPAQPPSMEAYLHMVAAAAQHYGFPLGAAAAAAAGGNNPGPGRLPLPMPSEPSAPFKLPPQASPNASSNHSEALDFRTNPYTRAGSVEPPNSDEDEEEEETNDANNPLDLSTGTRKRSAEEEPEQDSSFGQIQVKKIFKSESPPLAAPQQQQQQQVQQQQQQQQQQIHQPNNSMMPGVNPYLAAVAAANIFRTGQFPDWNGKNDLVIDPLEKMSDIVKGGSGGGSGGGGGNSRKEKNSRNSHNNNNQPSVQQHVNPQPPTPVQQNPPPPVNEGITKTRHNIWQSHWQNKGVASSVFRCVWCKQSFSTLEALTTHMKDSKHCGVNVPPFGNLPTANERSQMPQAQQQHNNSGSHHRQAPNKSNNSGPSQAAKNAFQYRSDHPTPLPRKLVRGQNVWLGKGVEQAMQILKCMRCGESFRSLNEMTKHMQETQHYTNILSQEQTISMKSNNNSAQGDNKDGVQSLSSEESRTLSAVLTCKVCDKAFNSLGDLSNHMAKNNHYAEPLMQSMGGGGGNRKRPAPKKREKSLPVRKLLEMKGAQDQLEQEMEMQKMQRPGVGPGSDKTEAALFAERMRQYISGIKPEEVPKNHMQAQTVLNKQTKSPDLLESKNGAKQAAPGSSSVLSAIEQMFTTSFDAPQRHASMPATSPSNSSTKNTSPVASSILKRLGIDENCDYNKPLIDTSDPFYQHYRYTSSERSVSECSAETHNDSRKTENPTPDKADIEEIPLASNNKMMDCDVEIKREPGMVKNEHMECGATNLMMNPEHVPKIKQEIKAELDGDMDDDDRQSPKERSAGESVSSNGTDYSNNNNINAKDQFPVQSPKLAATSPQSRIMPPRSPTDSHRSITPKSPASSIKSYDGGEKKYPSDSLNALSSMFDSLGSTTNSSTISNRPQPQNTSSLLSAKIDSPENLTTSNSLAALRQFCIKKEKTA